jgi:hypothetical protein
MKMKRAVIRGKECEGVTRGIKDHGRNRRRCTLANRLLWSDPLARFFGSFIVDPSSGTTLNISAADGSEATLDLHQARRRLPDKAMAAVVGAPRRIDSSSEEDYIIRSGHPQGMTPHPVRKQSTFARWLTPSPRSPGPLVRTRGSAAAGR